MSRNMQHRSRRAWKKANWRRWLLTVVGVFLLGVFVAFPPKALFSQIGVGIGRGPRVEDIPQPTQLQAMSRGEAREAISQRLVLMEQLQLYNATQRRQAKLDPALRSREEQRRARRVPLVPEHIPAEVLENAGEDGLPDFVREHLARAQR